MSKHRMADTRNALGAMASACCMAGLGFALVAVLASSAAGSECKAVIVSGDPGDSPAWAGNFSRWTSGWQKAFEQAKVPVANVRIVSGASAPSGEATDAREQALRALSDLAKACATEDQAVVVLIGHGYQSEGVGKLCLSGADLADADVAKALQPLRAKHVVVLVLAPEGAAWAKALAKPGRVVLCANVKQSAPYFGEFLLRALKPETPLLDAFNAASLATIAWYQNQYLGGDEKEPDLAKARPTIVHGRINQEVYRLVYAGQAFIEGDAEPRAADNDLNHHDAFTGRRVLAEVAGLDDNGDGEMATIFDAGKGETKPVGSGSDGALARVLVLGRP